MITVEQVSRPSDLARYRDEWKLLVSRSPDVTMFDTFEWLSNWLNCFWENKPIAFLFFRDGASLVGMAPLLEDEKGELWCAGTLVSPINNYSQNANVICAENPARIFEALLTYLQENRRPFSLVFPRTLATGPVARHLPEAANRCHLPVLLFDAMPSPIIRYNGDWEARLRGNNYLAGEVGRKVRRFERAGVAKWVVVDSAGFIGLGDGRHAVY